MANSAVKVQRRLDRQTRVRRQIKGTDAKPRLCVFRSNRYTYAQLISDETGTCLGSVSSQTLVEGGKGARSVELAKQVGTKIAELAKSKQIEAVVFDRNGYLYHGRVAAVAEGAREAGLTL